MKSHARILPRVLSACALLVAGVTSLGVEAGTNVWTPIGPPGDIWISAVAVNPTTPSTLYAGTGYSGLFKSTDSGRSWVVTSGIQKNDVEALAIDPRTPSTMYAAAGRVFKSTDAGDTWTATGAPFGVTTLAIDPNTPPTLYAGCRQDIMSPGGIFKSADAGLSWTGASSGLTDLDIRTIVIDPAVPATVYAGTAYGGVFKSTDAGHTWTRANTGLTNTFIHSLAIDPLTPSTIYAGTYKGVFKSTDAGLSWTSASAGLSLSVLGGIDSLVINPINPLTVYAGRSFSGVFKSTNGGETWSSMNNGLSVTLEALAIDPVTPSRIYAAAALGGLYVNDTAYTALVPIVLDVVGLAHYTSELQLTNLGSSSTTVKLSYTSSIGSGTGDFEETIPAGQQVVFPDAISHLRSKGVPIPTSGNQGGTLFVSAPTAGVRATVRTSADTIAPQPEGRAGLAYTDTDPAASSSATKLNVYGLRTGEVDRSNLAVYNMGGDPVSLKVTLVSGDDGSTFDMTAGVPLSLLAYGWYQYGDANLLRKAGFSSGYAVIERVSGTGPFGAYGVVNDQKTNDGSFIPTLSGTQSGSKLTVPVLVEAGTFESELILTNRGSTTATFTLRYVESLSPAKGTGGTTTVEVAAGRQKIIPKAIDFLRSKGVAIGARGEASYAGSLQVQVTAVSLENVFAGARTSSLSPAGGQFGLFYPAIDSSQEASAQAFVLGLKADVNNRSNVAVVHTGAEGSGPITLELQVLDGSEGGKAVGPPFAVTLNPGEWAQPSRFFTNGGVPNGYVRIRRTAGTAPWYAYGVINDGGNPGERTGDGAYVAMVK